MSTRTNMVLVVWRGHCSGGCDVDSWDPAIAQSKPATKKPPQDRLGLVELEVKQLALLTDTDKNGKISKQKIGRCLWKRSSTGWIPTTVENWPEKEMTRLSRDNC